jgi:pimeloyl-ACP methyl ester carboxylesterase
VRHRTRPTRFEHDGRVLLVREQGAEHGPVFVLVHGIGVSSRYFRRLAAALAPHGHVISVELPGFGGAPKPRRTQRVEDHGELIAAFLATRSGKAVLVGHSMGAQIVVDVALRAPTAVERIVLIGPVTDPLAPSPLRQGWRLLGLDTFVEPPMANVIVMTDYVRAGPVWYLRTLPSMLGYPMLDVLPLVRVPALVVRGSRDPVVPDGWARRVAALLVDSRFVTVPGAGHIAMFSHPALVARRILSDVLSAGR